ncbi:hypothetical protein EJ06DRAFT_530200 [Trichodelitschia bisporula]|uniref:Uncharacterized protein n=1 Tax=Trichodelitschia bisporula TaxID=703511 RepID=A0A6G1HWV1_9PEZI|nr:hypothetical protein EJ06DRAFT_530200 [Trichodelitschia bisporula]
MVEKTRYSCCVIHLSARETRCNDADYQWMGDDTRLVLGGTSGGVREGEERPRRVRRTAYAAIYAGTDVRCQIPAPP